MLMHDRFTLLALVCLLVISKIWIYCYQLEDVLMQYLISYDISDTTIRNKVVKYVASFNAIMLDIVLIARCIAC